MLPTFRPLRSVGATAAATTLLLLTVAPPVLADTITVCPVGCDSNSIQGAINSASPGDEVLLTTTLDHIENDIVVFQSVTLRGLPGQDSQLLAAASFAPSTPRTLTVLAGVELTIEDLMIGNAYTFGDGGAIHNQGTLHLVNVWISANRAKRGAAVFNQGTFHCTNSNLASNEAHQGAGVFNTVDATFQGVTCNMFDNELLEPSALASQASGGHLHNEGVATLHTSSLTQASGPTFILDGSVYGAGIYSAGSLQMEDSQLTNNHLGAPIGTQAGGGLYLAGGTATLLRVRLSSNDGGSDGGGIYVGNGSDLTGTDLILDRNEATRGGGIHQAGTLRIRGATIRDNEAGFGGGIYVADHDVELANVTISANLALQSGGGIFVRQQQAIELASSTIVGNEADIDQDNSGDGGGIYLQPGCASGICVVATAYLKNSILANNVDRSPSSTQAHDCLGDLRSNGPNLLEQVSTSSFAACELVGSTNGATLGVDPDLAPLANNGGPDIHFTEPQTHLPNAGSPARNAGDPNGCLDYDAAELTVDQRGAPRVGVCDLGAVEADSTPGTGAIFTDGFESGDLTAWSG